MRAVLLVAVTLLAGCTARVYSPPVSVQPATVSYDDVVVYVDTVPSHIESYPRYYYGDGLPVRGEARAFVAPHG